MALRVPCAYQGGKQRVAAQIATILLDAAQSAETRFYDLCCGSGAVTLELVNRGVCPTRIVMLDGSSWGAFWSAIGSGGFNLQEFDAILSSIPDDKRKVKSYVSSLASLPVGGREAELYPVLQSCAFGGKQISLMGGRWNNAFFRDYWEPTPGSVRRSPANPMQPSAGELRRRVVALRLSMLGVRCLHDDITRLPIASLPPDAVVYVDPPYQGTTGYGLGFDLVGFIARFKAMSRLPLFVSESRAIGDRAVKLCVGGANGGISGLRKSKHEEWISRL